MAEELKPCPFCGGMPDCHQKGNEHTVSRSTIIKCKSCNVELTVGAIRNTLEWTRATAVAAWNRRASRSEAEVLEEAAKAADDHKLGGGQMLSGTGIAAVHDGACDEIAAAIRALRSKA